MKERSQGWSVAFEASRMAAGCVRAKAWTEVISKARIAWKGTIRERNASWRISLRQDGYACFAIQNRWRDIASITHQSQAVNHSAGAAPRKMKAAGMPPKKPRVSAGQ